MPSKRKFVPLADLAKRASPPSDSAPQRKDAGDPIRRSSVAPGRAATVTPPPGAVPLIRAPDRALGVTARNRAGGEEARARTGSLPAGRLVETDDYLIGFLPEMRKVAIVQKKHGLAWTFPEDRWTVLEPDAHRRSLVRLRPATDFIMVRRCLAAYKNWAADPVQSAADIRAAARSAAAHDERVRQVEAVRRSCAARGISLEVYEAERRALLARSTSSQLKAAGLEPASTRDQAALWSAEYARAREAMARETENLRAAVSRWEREAAGHAEMPEETIRTAVVARGEAQVGRLTAALRKLADAARTRASQVGHNAGKIAAVAREAERAADFVRAAAAPRDVCQNADDAVVCVSSDLSVARAAAEEAAAEAEAFEAGLRSLVDPFLDAVRAAFDQLLRAKERASREAREARAKAIRTFCAERGITRVVHFTRVKNLDGIVRHGLLTREALESSGLPVQVSDESRNDGVRDSISLSIEFPNYRMFFEKRKRLGGADSCWVVLELDPRILWECPCLFFTTNASRTQSDRERRTEPRHLEEMFGDRAGSADRPGVRRSDLRIPDSYPTDAQAEVMALDCIPFDRVRAIHFGDEGSCTAFRRTCAEHASLARFFDGPDSLFRYRSDHAAQKEHFPSRSQEHT